MQKPKALRIADMQYLSEGSSTPNGGIIPADSKKRGKKSEHIADCFKPETIGNGLS